MKTLFTLLFACCFLVSCDFHLSYLGSSYSPTKNVDVYVDRSAIKKPYTIMGKSIVNPSRTLLMTEENLQAKAVALATQKGADAILFEELYRRYEGSNVHSVSKSDSVGKGVVTTTDASVGPNVSQEMVILFLKYD